MPAGRYSHDLFVQVHQFMVGVAPIRSLCRVGWAAKQLVSIPSDLLRNPTGQQQEVAVSRQLHRALAGFVRAVTLEALGLGATLAGGAQQLLGAPTAEEQPAGAHAHPVANKAALQQCCAPVASTCAAAATRVGQPAAAPLFVCVAELSDSLLCGQSQMHCFAAAVELGRNQEEGCLYIRNRSDLTRSRQPWGAVCLSLAVLWPQILLASVSLASG